VRSFPSSPSPHPSQVIFFVKQPKPSFCRQSCPQCSITTSFHHSAYAKSVPDGIQQEDDDTLECVPRNGEEELPSIGRKKTEEKRNPVKTSVPIRRGQRKRTRSAVGQEWDLLIALKRHKAAEKSQQQQKSRRWSGEFDQTKASLTIYRGMRGSVDSRDDEADFEKQRSFYAKLLFSDDSADDDDFHLHTTSTISPNRSKVSAPTDAVSSTREQELFNMLHKME